MSVCSGMCIDDIFVLPFFFCNYMGSIVKKTINILPVKSLTLLICIYILQVWCNRNLIICTRWVTACSTHICAAYFEMMIQRCSLCRMIQHCITKDPSIKRPTFDGIIDTLEEVSQRLGKAACPVCWAH